MPTLTRVALSTVDGELKPAGQRAGADSGDPQLRTLALPTGSDAAIGVWECEPGGWEVLNRPNTETFTVLSGSAVLTDYDTQEQTTISAGDLIILPPGWSGRWDVTETLRKAYSIF
ncbi:cupin domain-containing protein [Microbacterium paraoxydans]|uniref:cupin domain-containing protein n=1 Tax=Microbacterium paraoxydans TaxID=199592 RepID=UPI001CFA4CDA|nr:cupin domain-containing protein [Microbacterium paraoxydans]